jgi:hypothetical protein
MNGRSHSTLRRTQLDALAGFKEDDFTKIFLVPLFEAMGFERVEFHGGAYERGRDLIAVMTQQPGNRKRVVYVQSKKIGKQNTPNGALVTTLGHQLREAALVGFKGLDGNTYKPQEIYLACPEVITNRFLDVITEQLSSKQPEIIPYDGIEILKALEEHRPDLLELLTPFKSKLHSNLMLPEGNEELMSALKSTRQIKAKQFYCDLRFFVGSSDTNALLHLDFNFDEGALEFNDKEWCEVKEFCIDLENSFGLNLLTLDYDVIEEQYRIDYENHESDINKNTVASLSRNLQLLETDRISFLNLLNEQIPMLENAFLTYSKEGKLNLATNSVLAVKEYFERVASQLTLDSYDIMSFPDSERPNLDNERVKILTGIDKRVNKYLDLISSINELRDEMIPVAKYRPNINAIKIREEHTKLRKEYSLSIDKINAKKCTTVELKAFLEDTSTALSFISKLKEGVELLSWKMSFYQAGKVLDRVSISPHDIFSTGKDIAVYGGAGVGKTTTLQMYANSLAKIDEELLIYIQLNKVVANAEFFSFTNLEKNKYPKEHTRELILKIILVSRGIATSNDFITKVRKSLSGQVVLILDGIDEVYGTIPSLLPAIESFKAQFPNCQVIISSRDSVNYLSEINFLGITLLPFTEAQLDSFVRGWFGYTENAEKLLIAIKSKNLYEHIKTPLLATITCNLVEKGIDAPSTENEIYNERLSLLTGEYDRYKRVERQTQKGSLLRKLASYIAYSMHRNGSRDFRREKMMELLIRKYTPSYSKKLLEDCLNELIDPCNVIHKDAFSQTLSFGHFRFQEHLAAMYLAENRSVELIELVVQTFWGGALCLYAQTNDITNVIEDVYNKFGSVTVASDVLGEMINNTQKNKRRDLKALLGRYMEQDEMDRGVTALNYDDHDYSFPNEMQIYDL